VKPILRFLNVKPEERPLAGRLFLLSFTVGTGRVFAFTAAIPIFLSQWTPADLSYVYMLTALGTIAASAGYLRLGRVLSPRLLIVANLGFVVVVTLLLRLALAWPDVRWAAMALAVWAFVLLIVTNLAFWAAATKVVDIRQGKRLFALVGTGDVVAYAVGGFVAGQLADRIGTANLLLISAAGIGLALVTFADLARLHRERFAAVPAQPAAASQKKQISWSSPYLRLMIGYFVLSGAVFVFLDNAFNFVAKARYPVEADLVAFIGAYQAVTALINFAFRTFGAGRLSARFGVVAGLLGLPLAVLLGSSVVVVGGALFGATALVFWAMTVTRVGDKVFRGAMGSSLATLYQPLMSRGPAVQATMEGMVDAAAVGLSGFLLLLLGKLAGIGAVGYAAFLIAFCLVWVVIALRLRREYVGVLAGALERRRIGAAQLTMADGDVMALVRKELESPHPENVIYALDLVERFEPKTLRVVLPHLLLNAGPDVRLEILRRIEQQRITRALDAVKRQVTDPANPPALQGEAMRVLCVLSEESIPQAIAALGDDRQEVRKGALVGLLRSGSIEGIIHAGAELLRILDSERVEDRIFAAGVLEDTAIPSFFRQVRRLIKDPDVRVRRAAIRAAAQTGHSQLVPSLVTALSEPELAGSATQALLAIGEPTLPVLLRGFARYEWNRPFRLRVLRIMGLMGGEQAAEQLWSLADLWNREERHAALVALAQCGFVAAGERARRVRKLLRSEVQDAVARFSAIADMAREPSTGLLQAALMHEISQIRHRAFMLLSLIYPDSDALTAWNNYADGDAEKRAYALELMENHLSNELRGLLFPILEDLDLSERLARLGEHFAVARATAAERVAQLLQAREGELGDWTEWCARSVARELRLDVGPEETAATEIVAETLRLKSVELFEEMPEHVVAGLYPKLQPLEPEEGEVVFARGDVGDSLYIVTEGSVRVHDGDVTIATLGENQVFGEFTVLQAAERTASVTAGARTRLLRLAQSDLYDLVSERVQTARSLIQIILRRLEANRAARTAPETRASRLSISLKPLQ
jgi:HEAT repeat protein